MACVLSIETLLRTVDTETFFPDEVLFFPGIFSESHRFLKCWMLIEETWRERFGRRDLEVGGK